MFRTKLLGEQRGSSFPQGDVLTAEIQVLLQPSAQPNSQATELISLSAACLLRQPICPTYHLPDTQGLVAESRSLDEKRRRLTEVIAFPHPHHSPYPVPGAFWGVCGSR